ncbi:L-rhamnose-H+ transport protein [Chitinophaga terrae (ex Kim and Jung 2007)]|uniref:L-rhamnose/proton symporter RhaT n=1 Tax=Chitinophaga terrae (ex Kim and Jung 2007) TaxID=408074 RepID=UPI00277DB70A|nr:L-rhamnose/proton symporter RhaT [Chitinophaga terrae (ex Kim and Jung 2007)]MDQ0106283.1 L-rhamnose-H+ transport protein [Chitinophaga terrae (ex Kim and Jung 2007)]
MQALLGVLFHFIGGFASGSFYIPYKRVKGWNWESYWIVGGLFSWLIIPFIAAWLTVPGFMDIIGATPGNVLFWTYFLGVLWGIGGLTFGLSMRYLGMSLGMAVALGFCSAFGALIPPIYREFFSDDPNNFTAMLHSNKGMFVLLGTLVCLAGIAICGKAGMMKEKELSHEQKTAAIQEFNLRKGLAVAIVSGILSACMSFAISAGKTMGDAAVANNANPLFKNNVIFVVIMLGGLTTNLIWCVFLNKRNQSFGDYTNKSTPLARNYFFAALAGTTWFLQFFFYGMGESNLGNDASSWILHMAFIILISGVWGFVLKEWKNASRKTLSTISLGIFTIILSVVLVGYGNSLSN